LFDYHVHSDFSLDSKMCMFDACRKSIELGLSEIVFTDHIDLDWPDDVFPPYDIDTIYRYEEKIEKVKLCFASQLVVKKGVEIGLQPHTLDQCAKIIDSHDFDFVIASAHIINRQDPSLPKYFQNKSKIDSLLQYYEEILLLVKSFDNFNVLGHLDYIKRYMPYDYDSKDHLIGFDIIVEILKELIRKNKGIEVNTSGYRHVSNSPMPHFDIVSEYKNLGGSIITLGSDAHQVQNIAYNFQTTIHRLKEIGFDTITTFAKMKPVESVENIVKSL